MQNAAAARHVLGFPGASIETRQSIASSPLKIQPKNHGTRCSHLGGDSDDRKNGGKEQ